MDAEIVYADAALLVLNKPSGLLSVPGRGEDKQDCLSVRVQTRFPDALVVHRLDMATSGLLVMAHGIAVQRALGRAFANREVGKRYEAVVHGLVPPTPAAGRMIDLPIVVDWPRRPLRIIDPVHGQASQTRMHLLGQDTAAHTSRLALEPITGRSHQLRVHLQALGHPIVGDTLYAPAPVAAMAPRLLLHATRLALRHPVTGADLVFDCPCGF